MVGEILLCILLCMFIFEFNFGDYVFCICVDGVLLNGVELFVSFCECEGLILVFECWQVECLGLFYEYVVVWIILMVYFLLVVVGLIVVFVMVLVEVGISCNVMVGYFYDYLFVVCDEGWCVFVVFQWLVVEVY